MILKYMIKTIKCKISKSCILLPIPSAIKFYTKYFQVLDLHFMTFLSIFPKIVIFLPLIYHIKIFKMGMYLPMLNGR